MQRRTSIAVVAGAALALVVGVVVVAKRDGGESSVAPGFTTSTGVTTSTSTSTTAPPSSTTAGAPPASTTATTTPSPTTPAPPFESSISAVTAADLGATWREGCPVPPEDLRTLGLSHWGADGVVRQGRLVVHAAYAEQVIAAFRDIYAARFPVERMTPIDAYGGDDQASMRANNTSGFNCRFVSGTSNWSEHAFGRAIDVNPLVNPYVKGSSVDPPEGAPYADRRRNDPGMIHGGDAVVRAFAAQGWKWGGYWSNGRDYQHFSVTGR